MKQFFNKGLLASVLAAGVLSGCATGPNANPRDPLEPFNRGMFTFNDTVDRAVVKPVATAYRNITPPLVRTGVTNFFSNLSEVWSAVNNLLQFKGQAAGESVLRFSVNTFMGLGGIIDVASDMGIERHKEDFGQTLGYWGMPTGAYVVLPLLGPSTVRDTAALPVDWQGDLVQGINDVSTRNSLTAFRLVNIRANLLSAGRVIDDAALDKYTFTRDAYLQLRQAEVRDAKRSDDGKLDDDGKLN